MKKSFYTSPEYKLLFVQGALGSDISLDDFIAANDEFFTNLNDLGITNNFENDTSKLNVHRDGGLFLYLKFSDVQNLDYVAQSLLERSYENKKLIPLHQDIYTDAESFMRLFAKQDKTHVYMPNLIRSTKAIDFIEQATRIQNRLEQNGVAYADLRVRTRPTIGDNHVIYLEAKIPKKTYLDNKNIILLK